MALFPWMALFPPAPQSYEFWHALQTLGVPAELVVYAGEGHMFVKAANQVDFQDRTVAWFQEVSEVGARSTPWQRHSIS